MTIECPNCEEEFIPTTKDLEELEQDDSQAWSHSMQYLASGTINCPNCDIEIDIKYTYEEVEDTGEILEETCEIV